MPIATRYVSRPFHITDAAVPTNLSLEFIYNFFEANEKIAVGSAVSLNPYARAFRLTWSPLGFGNFHGNRSADFILEDDPLTPAQNTVTSSIVSDPFENVNETVPPLTRDSSAIFIQDQNLDIRIGNRIKESALLRGFITGSAADIATSAQKVLEGEFEQDWLRVFSPSAIENQARGSVALDNDSNDQSFQFLLDNERARASFIEFSGSPVSRASYDAFDSLKSAYSKTDDSPSATDTDPVFVGEIVEDGSSISTAPALLGYMIERFSSLSSNSRPDMRKFVRRGTRSYLDSEIVYGQTYSYRIRSVIGVYAEAALDGGGFGTCLLPFLSDPTKLVSLTAEESNPPPPPADFNLHWNYQDSTLQLIWSFPNNPQRDIKYWQIFRRNSVSDPFTLIRMIDFDDSAVRSQFPETIDPLLVTKSQSSINYYVDPEFSKDSDCIYTMCSVDAHGQSSNYGMQFRVRFDRYKNKLIKELISPSGAAKQYPNTYLNAELTLDSVKSSGATKMRIYFDPEYLVVKDADDRNQNFLRTSPSAIYKLQLINVDRQKQSDISISINDSTNYIEDVASS